MADNAIINFYLEDANGVRSFIAEAPALRKFWQWPYKELCGVDLNDGTLTEVARKLIMSHFTVEWAQIHLFNDECHNPAWDNFSSLREAEEYECSVTGEDIEGYSFVKLAEYWPELQITATKIL